MPRESETHAFVEPVRGVECVLAVTPEPGALLARVGVAHPGCAWTADVSVYLDAFYCAHCGYNGRISGAWVIDLLRGRRERLAAGG